jgi:glucokinase
VIAGHGFGGLYLDGGVMHRLHERGLFDFAAFEKFLVLPAAPVVRDALAAVPARLVTDPYVALKGLAALYGEQS